MKRDNATKNSAINFTPVANAVDAHNPNLIGNFVDHPIIAHANAPVMLATKKLAATGRARIGSA